MRPDRQQPRRGRDGTPDATVTGTAGDLYRAAWNRGGVIDVTGDPAVLDAWWGAVAPRRV